IGGMILALAGEMPEPELKRAVVFIDGQNLYHHARAAFDCTHPNYDVLALAKAITKAQGWFLKQVRFYTGTPELHDDPRWHNFWAKKLLAIKRQGVHVFSRRLRYREKGLGQRSHTHDQGRRRKGDRRSNCLGLCEPGSH